MANHRHTVQLRVSESGYEPVGEAAITQHAKFKPGSIVGGEIARSRSVVQNSYYWLVLTKIVEHTGRWDRPEALHEALKIATDHIEIVQLVGGRLIKIPQSTSFDAMNQTAFQEYLDHAFRVIEESLTGGKSIDQFMAEAGHHEPRPRADSDNAASQEASERTQTPQQQTAPETQTPRPAQPGDAPMTAPRRDVDKEAKTIREQIERLPTLGRWKEYSVKPRLLEWLTEIRRTDPKIHAEILDALAEKRGTFPAEPV